MSTITADMDKLMEGGIKKRLKDKSEKHAQLRLQVVLGSNAIARLDRLLERVEPNTRTEVFRVALRLFEDVVSELDKGNEFLIRDKKGQVYPYKVSLS